MRIFMYVFHELMAIWENLLNLSVLKTKGQVK